MVFKQYILSKPLLYVYFSASVRVIMISFKYPFPHLVPDCIADQLCKLSVPHPRIHYPDRNFSSKPVPTAQCCSPESEKKIEKETQPSFMNHAAPNGDSSRYSACLSRCKVVNYQTVLE